MIYVDIFCHTVPFKVTLLITLKASLLFSIIFDGIASLVFNEGSFWLTILWSIPIDAGQNPLIIAETILKL